MISPVLGMTIDVPENRHNDVYGGRMRKGPSSLI